MTPDPDKPFADVLAENGRPVTQEQLDRARRTLAEAANLDSTARAARAALLERLNAA